MDLLVETSSVAFGFLVERVGLSSRFCLGLARLRSSHVATGQWSHPSLQSQYRRLHAVGIDDPLVGV